ncbi:twin-arginine translocation signal domain-containing protein [Nonomuraea sp. KM88]|uniref:twin-arginine translocation signal domain-containing protein n=1 Tax=Nonomuraea sp. KM88 TaxID=3457427 RepID=UPI003FCDF767
MTTVTPVRRSSRRRFIGLSAAVAGAAAATTAVLMLTGMTGGPAYAVTRAADGGVRVQINELTDPEGLQSELAGAGVKAVVDYLPFGQTCQGSRGRAGSVKGQLAVSIGRAGDGISFSIEKGQVPAGETLVLAVTKARDGDDKPPVATHLQVVRGSVAPCQATSMSIPSPGADDTSEQGTNDTGTNDAGTDEDGGPSLSTKTEGRDAGPHLDPKTR